LPPGGFEGKYENWTKRVHPDDLKQTEENLQTALNGGAPFSSEFRVVWEDGQTRWMLGKGDLYLDENGKLFKLVGVNIDITERKLAQIELNDFRDQFLSVVSHDLRSPLTSIKGFAELLKRGFEKELQNPAEATNNTKLERYRRQAESILSQTIRMNEMIDHLLDYSRIEQGRLKLEYTVNADIVELVKEVIETHRVTSNDHHIHFPTQEQPVGVDLDKLRIEQVLNNLIHNALKYSPANTTVTVAVSRQAELNEVVVSVRDEGYGIPKEQQPRLFERFYRVQTEQNKTIKGTGLGLYISSQIVKQHGGRIWFESEFGKGSTFYFSLPLSSNITGQPS
jgi:two-component system, OmpR family, sensor histidine kinase VicK